MDEDHHQVMKTKRRYQAQLYIYSTPRLAISKAAPRGMKNTPNTTKVPMTQAGDSTGCQAQSFCCLNLDSVGKGEGEVKRSHAKRDDEMMTRQGERKVDKEVKLASGSRDFLGASASAIDK